MKFHILVIQLTNVHDPKKYMKKKKLIHAHKR